MGPMRLMGSWRWWLGVVFDIRSNALDNFLENFVRLRETGDRIDFEVEKCQALPELEEEGLVHEAALDGVGVASKTETGPDRIDDNQGPIIAGLRTEQMYSRLDLDAHVGRDVERPSDVASFHSSTGIGAWWTRRFPWWRRALAAGRV